MGGDVMREMKDSGLEWVGEVGIDCSFVPLKYITIPPSKYNF